MTDKGSRAVDLDHLDGPTREVANELAALAGLMEPLVGLRVSDREYAALTRLAGLPADAELIAALLSRARGPQPAAGGCIGGGNHIPVPVAYRCGHCGANL